MDSIHQVVALVGLAAVVFASTNTDDLFLLIGFFSDPSFKARQVVVGQYLGIVTLTVFSVVCSLTAVVIPPAYIGLLGVFPLGIGVKKFLDLRKPEDEEKEEEEEKEAAELSERFGRWKVFAVAAVTVANGGDNLGVYIPLFATQGWQQIGVFGAVFLLLTAVWCGVAYYLVNNRWLGAPIRRYGRIALPFVLVGLGIYILAGSRSLIGIG